MTDEIPPEWGVQPTPPPPPFDPQPQSEPYPPLQPPTWQATPQGPPSGYAYTGPTRTEGTAIGALVCGIIGLIFCGIVFGAVALGLGFSARNKIDRSNGQLTGRGMATAGIVLGIIDLIFGVLLIMYYASR